MGWPSFPQSTVGKQLVRAADSVGANLHEGDGRHSNADASHFFVMARASLQESRYWLRVALDRNLVSPEVGQPLLDEADEIGRMIQGLIRFRRSQPGLAKEEREPYEADAGPDPPD